MRGAPAPRRAVRAAGLLSRCGVLLAATLIAAPAPGQPPEGPQALQAAAAGVRIDPASITLSGISSGAYLAQQFHVAHSRHVRGVGLIAGGPYRCAAGSYAPWYFFDVTGLYAATSVCSDTNPWWFYRGPPDPEFSVAETRRDAGRGAVDDPAGLRGDRVWLLSGSEDETVPRGVVAALEQYYRAFVDAPDLHHERLEGAGHAMITDDAGNACDTHGAPYINDCDFDAAGALLGYLLGPLAPPAARLPPEALRTFDQGAFFDPDEASVSLAATGHLYVPAACAAGETCGLHVALHGCRQNVDAIGDLFVTRAGYNEWAESNRLVVLYPQTRALDGLLPGWGDNPRGCWDWWGYSGDGYATRSGAQIRALAGMINVLLGRDLLRE